MVRVTSARSISIALPPRFSFCRLTGRTARQTRRSVTLDGGPYKVLSSGPDEPWFVNGVFTPPLLLLCLLRDEAPGLGPV